MFVKEHKPFKKLIFFNLNWNLYEWVHFFNVTFLKIGPCEIRCQGKLIFQSISFIRVGSNLSGFIIKDKEEAGIDIILIEINAFKLVPEISLITNKIPTKLLLIEIEVNKMFIISSLNGFKILFGLHFFLFREWENISNLCLVIVQSAIKFSTCVLIFELICMSEDLNMNDRTDIYLSKLEVKSHSFELSWNNIYKLIWFSLIYFLIFLLLTLNWYFCLFFCQFMRYLHGLKFLSFFLIKY